MAALDAVLAHKSRDALISAMNRSLTKFKSLKLPADLNGNATVVLEGCREIYETKMQYYSEICDRVSGMDVTTAQKVRAELEAFALDKRWRTWSDNYESFASERVPLLQCSKQSILLLELEQIWATLRKLTTASFYPV